MRLGNRPCVFVKQGLFAAHGHKPRIRLTLGSNEAIKQAVAGGLGCAVISHHALMGDGADEGVARVRVAGFPIRSQWFIVTLRGKKLSPVAAVFRQYLQAAARDMGVWRQ